MGSDWPSSGRVGGALCCDGLVGFLAGRRRTLWPQTGRVLGSWRVEGARCGSGLAGFWAGRRRTLWPRTGRVLGG